MNDNEQRLLAVILDLFAEEFGKEAVLRGDMVLKILGSNRYTNDLDCVFIPYRSKNQIVRHVLRCLGKIPNVMIRHSLNSQCLRILVSQGSTTVQVEAKVAERMKTDVLTTATFSPRFNLPKRLIHIVDHSVSLANNLAAWNERRLIRDVYDVWYFLQLSVSPDLTTLSTRLKKPRYSRAVKNRSIFKVQRFKSFYDFFRMQIANLTDQDVEEQLSDYLLPDELTGLLSPLKAGIIKLQDPLKTPIKQ